MFCMEISLFNFRYKWKRQQTHTLSQNVKISFQLEFKNSRWVLKISLHLMKFQFNSQEEHAIAAHMFHSNILGSNRRLVLKVVLIVSMVYGISYGKWKDSAQGPLVEACSCPFSYLAYVTYHWSTETFTSSTRKLHIKLTARTCVCTYAKKLHTYSSTKRLKIVILFRKKWGGVWIPVPLKRVCRVYLQTVIDRHRNREASVQELN